MKRFSLLLTLALLCCSVGLFAAQPPTVNVKVHPMLGQAPGTVTVPGPPSTTYAIDFSWTAATGCATATPCTYQVYCVPTANQTIVVGTTGATLVATSASQATTAVDSTVVNGSTYSCAVETVQAGANSAPSTTVQAVIPNPTVPSAPSGVTATVTP
jgi:hypothetical protein